MIIHPLRFARRPCLRGTVSYCLLMQTRWHHESYAILFICADRVFLSSSFLSLFFSFSYSFCTKSGTMSCCTPPMVLKFYLDCHYSDCMSFAGKALRDFSIPCWSLLCFYFITGRIGWSVLRPFVHILIISLDINKAYAS